MRMEANGELVLPKNIRQMGTFGDTYKVYVEDFVYTYVHQFIHRRKKEELVLAAVLLGKTLYQDGQEYIFISGAQKVDFQFTEEPSKADKGNSNPEREAVSAEGEREDTVETETEDHTSQLAYARQQEFWDRVYQRIKEYFDDCEILGWYFNLDGSNLEVNAQLQKFFESTYKKGSRFLYYEDSLEKEDAFFVQEQHRLQRLSGYAVYYEKNPQMQEFMVAEKERTTPKPLRDSYVKEDRDEVVQNYRAIMNKLNEKPQKKKIHPVLYVTGAAVLALVIATGVSQIGNYQNLKVLEQTMQTLSGAVGGTAPESEIHEDSRQEEDTTTKAPDAGVPESTTEDQTITNTPEEPAPVDTNQEDVNENNGAVAEADEGQAEPTETDVNTPQEPAEPDAAETEAAPNDYYIVKKGDSLVSISKKIYNTSAKVEDICQINQIENMDMIYEGQKLLLPH